MYFKVTEKAVLDEAKSINEKVKIRHAALNELGKELKGEVHTYPGIDFRGELLGFAGVKFKDAAPKGWKKNKDGLALPKFGNREDWHKINDTRVSHNKLMEMLNFPESGIRKITFIASERGYLYGLFWKLVDNDTALIFKFPDQYLTDTRPMWTPPQFAQEILASEFMALKDGKGGEQNG
ncbi:MAG: hypothetical protein A2020_12305 [Lentisphaerae bacterium GWF2_45_14]|nr:MAG: hypothetical protein A2020_12305 [Lentisphaerae bacterium GWF2_45_14]